MKGKKYLVHLLFMVVVTTLCLAQGVSQVSAAKASQSNRTMQLEVAFRNGDVVLSGTLVKPASGGPFPAVVIVHGSDPDVRGPLLGYAAEVFAQHGIAALAYDKRGKGKSNGYLNNATLEDLAADALAGLEYLKTRPDIDATHLGMVGDSQAGWIIPIAASRSKDVAFMVLVSASAVSPGQQEIFHIESELRASGVSERVVNSGRKARQLLGDYVVAVNRGQLPATADFKQIDGINLGEYHDPVPVLQQLTRPVLIILGGRDPNVPTYHSAAVFDRVLKSAGNTDYTIILYPDADHSIADETGYVPSYRPNITNWVLAHVGMTGQPLEFPPAQAFSESTEFTGSGVYALPPWYGTAAGQFAMIGLFALVFLSALVGLPIAALVQLLIRRDRRAPQPRAVRSAATFARTLAVGACLLNLLALAGTVIFVANVLSIEEGDTFRVDTVFEALPILGLLVAISAAAICAFATLAWKNRYWSIVGRVHYSVIALAAVLFVPFLGYWNMLGFSL
jgi:dienelactone hydrolase